MHFPSKLWKQILYLDRWINCTLPCLSHWIQLWNSYEMNGAATGGLWKAGWGRRPELDVPPKQQYISCISSGIPRPGQKELWERPSDSESRVGKGTQNLGRVGNSLLFFIFLPLLCSVNFRFPCGISNAIGSPRYLKLPGRRIFPSNQRGGWGVCPINFSSSLLDSRRGHSCKYCKRAKK